MRTRFLTFDNVYVLNVYVLNGNNQRARSVGPVHWAAMLFNWTGERAPFCVVLLDARFTCGKADRSSRGELPSFFFPSFGPKRAKTAQTSMVTYVIWAINFKYDFIFDIRGCL